MPQNFLPLNFSGNIQVQQNGFGFQTFNGEVEHFIPNGKRFAVVGGADSGPTVLAMYPEETNTLAPTLSTANDIEFGGALRIGTGGLSISQQPRIFCGSGAPTQTTITLNGVLTNGQPTVIPMPQGSLYINYAGGDLYIFKSGVWVLK